MTVNKDPRNSRPLAFRTYKGLRKRFDNLLIRYRYHASIGEIPEDMIPNPGQVFTDFLAAKVEEWEEELEVALATYKRKQEINVK